MRRVLIIFFIALLPVITSAQHGKLLFTIGQLIEKDHYHPKAIDDDFSRALFKKYIENLDPFKSLFLLQDIKDLKKFETTLDDEIHGTKRVAFLPAVLDLYAKRLSEAIAFNRQLSVVPFRYEETEEVYADGRSADDFAPDERSLKEVQRKLMKYLSLQYVLSLSPNHAIAAPDSVIEKTAREKAIERVNADYTKLLQNANENWQFSAYVTTLLHLMDPHTDYFPAVAATNLPSGVLQHTPEPAVRSAVIEKGNYHIGYITFPSFYADSAKNSHCASDVAKVLVQLEAAKIDGIVFDLRNNPGGSLQEVLRITGLLIKNSPVVQIRLRGRKPATLQDDPNDQVWQGPLAVMVNEKTASAAELFTAAIQDHHRGVVIGSGTYGKGTVQRPFALGDHNGVLKLTFEQFFRVNGSSTQIKGITPDIRLTDAYAARKVREKDNATALPWDSLAPVKYQQYQYNFDIPELRKLVADRLINDSAFTAVEKYNSWVEAQEHKKVSLKLAEFRAGIEENNRHYLQVMVAVALPEKKQLNIMSLSGDSLITDADRKTLKILSRDIYLNEAILVINDMLAKTVMNTLTSQ